MNQEGKKKIVAELKEKFQKCQSLVFANFIGMTVKQMEHLRKRARASNIEVQVVKNRLAKRAYEVFEDEEGLKFLTDNTAICFGFDDPIAPIKVLLDYIKEENIKLELKGALVEGKCIDKEGIKPLALIPSREILLSQLLANLQSPQRGFLTVLNGPMRSLINVLKSIEKKKS